LKTTVADEKPHSGSSPQSVKQEIAREGKGSEHLDDCAFNRESKAQRDINIKSNFARRE